MARKQGLQLRPNLISIAVASCFVTTTALANPTGPTVVHGTASIQQIGNLLQVTNSPSAVINWQSFSIGANEITRFIQQSSASAVLNRVTGNAGVIDPSVILGALQSNGRVFLINPSGILFGAGAQIDVAGLVASSLNLSNADFLANRLKFTDGLGAGSVINQGNITTGSGGPVYLVGSAVTNNGIITSPQGEVVLAAGQSVELVSPGTPNLRVEITAPENEAINLGTIVAEAGRIGIHAGIVRNSGTVSASSAVAEGGKILLKATKEVTLESTSILDASGAGGGTIEVLAKNGGTVNVNGRLDASAPVSGDGGFIETSADKVTFAPGTVVTTAAANGKTGQYLIDPYDLLISAYGGDLTGDDVESLVLANHVTLTSDQGANAYGSGNITVNDIIDYSSSNSLTMLAKNAILVNAPISNGGNGDINLYGGWDGSIVGAPAVVQGVGSVQVAAPISTLGNVLLIAGDHAHQTSYGGSITANGLRIDSLGTSANFNLATNMVNTVAGKSVQGFHFANGKTLAVGTVAGRSGIEVTAGYGGSATVTIDVVGSTGAANLNVNNNINATGSNGYGGNIGLNVSGSYGGAINVTNASLVASGVASSGGGLNSSIDLLATSVNITSSTLQANGTQADYGGGAGEIWINANGAIAVSGSVIRARGGNGGESGGDARVDIHSDSGTLAITGGSTIEALGGTAGVGYSGGDAEISLGSNSVSTINVTGSTVRAIAGTGGFAGDAWVEIMDGASNINITSSTIQADGAEGSIYINAAGGITIGGSQLIAKGLPGSYYGAYINIYGDNVAISNSTLTATGNNNPDGWGGYALINLYAEAGDGVSITGSTVQATGGTGAAPDQQGNAYVWIGTGLAGGDIVIDSSTIGANGQNAMIYVSSDGNIGASNSTIAATARSGADGGEGFVYVDANGTINTGSSTVSATGGGGCCTTFVSFYAPDDITLGLLSSSGDVDVSSGGSIIDGNAGVNASAPVVYFSANSGIGTLDNPLETVASILYLQSNGGEIGVINSGDLILWALNNGGSGANAVGTTGTMTFDYLYENSISVDGNLSLLANGSLNLTGITVQSGGDLVLIGGGSLNLTEGASAWGQNVALGGGAVTVNSSTVSANDLMLVSAGTLNVVGTTGPAGLYATEIDITAGTAVNVTNAGFPAEISASSVETINLTFPTLSSGGIFVNGIPGVVDPQDSTTGFFLPSGQVTGIPFEGFNVTYGSAALPPPVQQGVDQVISSTNDQDKEPENNTSDSSTGGDGKEKKELPVCS